MGLFSTEDETMLCPKLLKHVLCLTKIFLLRSIIMLGKKRVKGIKLKLSSHSLTFQVKQVFIIFCLKITDKHIMAERDVEHLLDFTNSLDGTEITGINMNFQQVLVAPTLKPFLSETMSEHI